MSKEINAQVVVLGAGPGGYSAAFRAADLGLETVLVERYSTLGGVCLNVGCIPSKALLHLAKHIEDAKHMDAEGVEFGEPKIDLDKIRKHKEKVVGQLTGGLGQMSKMRKVKVVTGKGEFASDKQLSVKDDDGNETLVNFEHAIIATAHNRSNYLSYLMTTSGSGIRQRHLSCASSQTVCWYLVVVLSAWKWAVFTAL